MKHLPGQTALCHEWVTTYGGSEQVAAHIAGAVDADEVFTYAAEPSLLSRLFPQRTTTVVGKFGTSQLARRRWSWFLPFMPLAWKRLNLERFDVVLTSAHSCVNAIKVHNGRHISYCHTPMRYAWDWRSEIRRIPFPLRPIWPVFAAFLRRADRRWAKHVDVFIANSENVAERIRENYGRSALVVYPPIDTTFWTPGDEPLEDFFLVAGRLVAYKRTDICVEAARLAKIPLVVAGNGPELARLKRIAGGANVKFIVSPSQNTLRQLYRRAAALIFAGVEDFGMTLVEAQACGTPVIAYREGGASEAVVPGRTGILFDEHTSQALANEMRNFDRGSFAVDDLRRHAERFSIERFRREIREIVLDSVTP